MTRAAERADISEPTPGALIAELQERVVAWHWTIENNPHPILGFLRRDLECEITIAEMTIARLREQREGVKP